MTVSTVSGERVRCALLIGADGNQSAVRQHVQPGAAPEYVGACVWRFFFTEENPFAEEGEAWVLTGNGKARLPLDVSYGAAVKTLAAAILAGMLGSRPDLTPMLAGLGAQHRCSAHSPRSRPSLGCLARITAALLWHCSAAAFTRLKRAAMHMPARARKWLQACAQVQHHGIILSFFAYANEHKPFTKDANEHKSKKSLEVVTCSTRRHSCKSVTYCSGFAGFPEERLADLNQSRCDPALTGLALYCVRLSEALANAFTQGRRDPSLLFSQATNWACDLVSASVPCFSP